MSNQQKIKISISGIKKTNIKIKILNKLNINMNKDDEIIDENDEIIKATKI